MKNRLVITGLCASAFCRSAFYSALDDCDTEKVVLNEGLNILRGEIDHHCGYSVYSAVSPSEELDRIRKIISKYAGEMLCHLCSNARTAAETVVQ